MKEGIIIAVVTISFFFAILFWRDIQGIFDSGRTKGMTSEVTKGKKKKDKDSAPETASTSVRVIKRWDMPEILTEISGISYIDKDRFACIQDETGTVFIYNISSSKIEKEIPFAGPGDYEGVTWTGEAIYVVRADGKLFEINGMNNVKPAIKQYETGLTLQDNVESLGYDKKNNRLLLTGKESNPEGKIYAFDLGARKMASGPVYSVDMTGVSFKSGKKSGKKLQPSGLGVNPVNGDVYITDGPGAGLLILDASGKIKAFHQLDSKEFPQAEGVSFSESGDVYISTEGKKQAGAIVHIEMSKS